MNPPPAFPDALTLALRVDFNDHTIIEWRCCRCRCLVDLPVLYITPRWTKPGWHCQSCVQQVHVYHGKAWRDVVGAFCHASLTFYARQEWLKYVLEGVKV